MLPRLAQALGSDAAVVCAQAVCWEEQQAERRVEEALGQQQQSLRRVWESTMYHPDDLALVAQLIMPDSLSDTFTPWRSKVEARKVPVRPSATQPPRLSAPAPEALSAALQAISQDPAVANVGVGFLPTLAQLGCDQAEAEVDMRGDFFSPVGGETAALARLKRYVWDENRLKDYFDTRNGMIGQGYRLVEICCCDPLD